MPVPQSSFRGVAATSPKSKSHSLLIRLPYLHLLPNCIRVAQKGGSVYCGARSKLLVVKGQKLAEGFRTNADQVNVSSTQLRWRRRPPVSLCSPQFGCQESGLPSVNALPELRKIRKSFDQCRAQVTDRPTRSQV